MTPEKLEAFDELVRKFAEALEAHSIHIEWHGRPYSVDRNITIHAQKRLKGQVQDFFLNYVPQAVREKKFGVTIVPGEFLRPDVYPQFPAAEAAISFLKEVYKNNQ